MAFKINYLKYTPWDKLINLGLDPTDIAICSAVVSFAKTDKPLIAGYQTFAKALGIGSGKTLQRRIPNLIELNLITMLSGFDKKNANQYKPTKKLLSLYGQKVQSKLDKKSSNTSSKEEYKEEKKVGTLGVPPSFQKKYDTYTKEYGAEYANYYLQLYLEKSDK